MFQLNFAKKLAEYSLMFVVTEVVKFCTADWSGVSILAQSNAHCKCMKMLGAGT
jgi:hypothetical protein